MVPNGSDLDSCFLAAYFPKYVALAHPREKHLGKTSSRRSLIPEPATWPWPVALISGLAVIAENLVTGFCALQGNSRSQQRPVVCRIWISLPFSPGEGSVAHRAFIPSSQSLSPSSLSFYPITTQAGGNSQ